MYICVYVYVYIPYIWYLTIRVGQWQCIKMLIQQCPIPGHNAPIAVASLASRG